MKGRKQGMVRQEVGGKGQMARGEARQGEEQSMVRCQSWSKVRQGKAELVQFSQSKRREVRGEEQSLSFQAILNNSIKSIKNTAKLPLSMVYVNKYLLRKLTKLVY